MEDNLFSDLIPDQGTSEEASNAFSDLIPAKQEKISRFSSGVEGAAQSLSFGLNDEQRAIGRAVGGELREFFGGQDSDFSATYGSTLDDIRGFQKEAKRQNPVSYGAGEITGAVGGGLATGGAGITRAIPALASAIKEAPFRASAGIGAVQGGLYGFGSGEGGAGDRIQNAKTSALFGAGGGVAGAGIARMGGRAVGPLTKKVQSYLSKKKSAPAPSMETTLPISGKSDVLPVDDLSQKSNLTRMLKGAATDDIDLMRKEEMARQGMLGKDLETKVRSADDLFIDDVKGVAQSLAGKNIKDTADETLLSGIEAFKKRAGAEKKLASRLMNVRNDKIARAKIYQDYTQNTLGKQVDDIVKTPDFEVNLPKENMSPIRDEITTLKRIIGKAENVGSGEIPLPDTSKPIDFNKLQAWRSGLNSYKAGSQEGVMAKQLAGQYDDWLNNLSKEALMSGDEDLVDQIFRANAKYAEFKGKYGTNKYKGQKKLIEDIITQEEMTPRAMVNTVFGSNLKGNNYTSQYVKRMIDAMPENRRGQVRDAFRAGLYQRAFERATEKGGFEVGKFRNGLIDILKNDSYKAHLSNPDTDRITRSLIDDLSKYMKATGDRSIVNFSGTAPMLSRLAQLTQKMPIIGSLPTVRASTEGLSNFVKEGAKVPDKRAVEKSLSSLSKEISSELSDVITYYGASAGGRVAAEENPMTVRPASPDKLHPDIVNEDDWITLPDGEIQRK